MAMSRFLGGIEFIRISPIWIVPLSTRSRPAIMRKVVDLPQPDGPTNTKNSPGWTSILTPFTACTSPEYHLFTCSNVNDVFSIEKLLNLSFQKLQFLLPDIFVQTKKSAVLAST